MDPVQKALWFVESHSREPLALDDIARACHVSAYHLTRAFAAATGTSLIRYLRGRRLSEAAQQLADGAEDILRLALETGYGSHEAFTRAFREQFGLTPEQVRAQRHVSNLPLIKALDMSSTPAVELPTPRFESHGPMQIAGLLARYNCQEIAGIPDQWQRFLPHCESLPGQVGPVSYGVCANFDTEGNFDYLCGVEVRGTPALPEGLTTIPVPAGRYVVFAYPGHIAGIRGLFSAIWGEWFPKSGHEPAEAPTLERYGPEFNGKTGMGGFEIWIPIKS
jgi:AraC family transcriptional regulator